MAEKKKMSVAEMIAAARKADGGGAAAPESSDTGSSDAGEASPAPAATPAASSSPPKKVAPPGSADRPSVKDILAMARSAGAKEEGKPAEKKAAPKKPAAKKKPAAAAKPAEPRDTASILAAARKSSKAGPMNKAEAAAKAKANPKPAAKAKPKIVVPPMPVKSDFIKAKPAKSANAKGEPDDSRREFMSIGFGLLAAASAVFTLACVKFMFPNVLREPPSKFKVGLPDAFPSGQIETKYKAQFAVWVGNSEVNGQQQIYALKSVCTHLGCTPNWLESEQKYKCPCHGSGFYKDGINFEGPAPRPLERYAIRIADDGQIEIDKSRLFMEEKGEWEDPACYIPV